MTTTAAHPMLKHLRNAVQLFADHGPKEMSDYITSAPFRETFSALKENTASATLYKKCSQMLHLLEHATLPDAKAYVQPLMTQVASALRGSQSETTVAKNAYDVLLKGLSDIDHLRTSQAAALTAGEAAHYAQKGPLAYATDLAKRRWNANGHILPSSYTPPAAGKAASVAADALFKTNVQPCAAGCTHAPAPAPTSAVSLENPKALEEFGQIKLLDTPIKKLAIAAGATVGLGLVIHGGSNVISGARGEHDPSLELAEQAQEHAHHGGMNISRLVVGLAEMAAGAALVYRMLTGRMALRSPVSGKANSILSGCSHGHGL